ncbi:MAG: hypothetical protein PHO44_08275 [Sphaerochaetaceae bacterium]|nr:hypothetical protein [Sphaerochaetaceae bacterium]MDD3163698.1 hypothetical protein [Sphaerochaetaceae bacterium]MDD4007961.1 hypothetical protein [Sphaerochaetaceae bacterium]MDD4397615.1 hypothetical protein [Sphaerochaetaceae bacterium]
MKKTSKACFIIGIIVLALAAVLIAVSFIPSPVQYHRSFGFYSIEYTTQSTGANLRTLILGCTGIISGLLLFILSSVLRCDCTKACSAPAAEAKKEVPAAEAKKDEPVTEAKKDAPVTEAKKDEPAEESNKPEKMA